MQRAPLLYLFLFSLCLSACTQGGNNSGTSTEQATAPEATATEESNEPSKGIGEVEHVTLSDPMDEGMIKGGQAIYEMKCAACHKLTDQRVVGPGWEGVTNHRTPEWIMNMITNVDIMLAQDEEAQKLLEECLTRMPNQSVSVGDARDILEFMRQNDLERTGEKDQGKTSN